MYVNCVGPSGLGAAGPPRSRGRPTIGPHQRTDIYGLPSSIYNSNTTQHAGPSGKETLEVNPFLSHYFRLVYSNQVRIKMSRKYPVKNGVGDLRVHLKEKKLLISIF